MNDRIVKSPRDSEAETRHEEHPIVETTEEARQGETWAPMQRVLVGGIALVVIAFLVIYLVFAL